MSFENKTDQQTPGSSKTWRDRIPTFIAITTLLLAVCATLASFKAAGFGNKMVLAQSQASDHGHTIRRRALRRLPIRRNEMRWN